MKNIFVTGANGFVGSHLIEKLLNDGHNVWALVRNPQKVDINSDRLTLIEGDLEKKFSIDPLILSEIDIIVHTAGIVHSFNSEDFYRINAEGTKNLIDQFGSKSKCHLKFILISSLAARGPYDQIPCDQPVSDYGKSKKLAEDILINHGPSHWTKIIIRPPMVIGPKDTAVLDIFKMVRDRIILLPGIDSRKKMYSFVCVHDLVDTVRLTFEVKSKDSAYLFYSSYPETFEFEKLIESIKIKMEYKNIFYLPVPKFIIFILAHFLKIIYFIKKHNLRITPDKNKELFPARWICSLTPDNLLLQQQYHYDLEKTIEITFQDYCHRKWL